MHMSSKHPLHSHSISTLSAAATNPLHDDIIYLNNLTEITETNRD